MIVFLTCLLICFHTFLQIFPCLTLRSHFGVAYITSLLKEKFRNILLFLRKVNCRLPEQRASWLSKFTSFQYDYHCLFSVFFYPSSDSHVSPQVFGTLGNSIFDLEKGNRVLRRETELCLTLVPNPLEDPISYFLAYSSNMRQSFSHDSNK